MNIVRFLRTRILKNILEELFLKKLAASVLALLSNANYLFTGYEHISEKNNSCKVKKCLRFDFLKIKNNPQKHLP